MTSYGEQQRQLTQQGLAALDGTEFALAGAGAIREHGLTSRPTQDIDLFTADFDADVFAAAADRLTRHLVEADHTVEVVRAAPTFRRLIVTAPGGTAFEIDLAADWRSGDSASLPIGRVLAVEDAVGSKINALYSRAETRDFLDADAIRQSGRFSDDQLLAIVGRRDPGFDRAIFAAQLALVTELTASEVARYDVAPEQLAAVQQRLSAWAQMIHGGEPDAAR